MKKTYVIGHKKPDSDSVMSAIALSYLKNQLGEKTEPRVIGTINKETKYALNFFNLKEPMYLNNVKLQLRDVNYNKGFMINENDCIHTGYQMMLDKNQTGIPIVNSLNKFIGLITIKDLSHKIINEENEKLETSYKNLLKVLKAEEVLHFDDELVGNLLVAAYRSTTFINNIKLTPETILVVGDRHSIIEYAVNSDVKMLIITGSGKIKDEHIEIARKKKINIIRTDFDTYTISRLLPLSNYIKTLIRSYNPTKFEDTDYVSDVLEINSKLKHTNYPIVNHNNDCLGLLKIIDLNEKNPKKVILVDHNEKLQSVDGIEEASIVEIIDHHNIGSITTIAPVNFRNMSVGSTCTIVYTMYKDANIEIPKSIAGGLLSGILSDTLILKSPTATKIDIEVVEELSKIIGLDYKVYGMELLKAGTSLEGMTKEDVLYNDFKKYNINDKTFAIGQFITMDFDTIRKDIPEYVKVLNEVAVANEYSFVGLYFTDIINNGSYILYSEENANIANIAYNLDKVPQGYFIKDCVSRKKHIIPLLMEIFED